MLLGAAAVTTGLSAESRVPKFPPDMPLGPLIDSPVRLIAFDPRFRRLFPFSPVISRLQTGSIWSEGPAWSPVGHYLVWSDVPNDRQLRWLEEDGHVSVFRQSSNKTNGCTFDLQGRMITCEQTGHSVVRHETDGTQTVLASAIEGRRFNSPNDVVIHADGAVWFTDPGYGGPDPLPHKEAVYRIDPIFGHVERVEHSLVKPNGICFSPDFKRLYLADTGMPHPKALYVFDVVEGRRLANKRPFATLEHQGLVAGPDGQKTDEQGNLWASAGHGPEGSNGVHVFAPDGTRLGVILLPETCANVCFGGTGRNRLFITATQSLYAIETATRGAHLS